MEEVWMWRWIGACKNIDWSSASFNYVSSWSFISSKLVSLITSLTHLLAKTLFIIQIPALPYSIPTVLTSFFSFTSFVSTEFVPNLFTAYFCTARKARCPPRIGESVMIFDLSQTMNLLLVLISLYGIHAEGNPEFLPFSRCLNPETHISPQFSLVRTRCAVRVTRGPDRLMLRHL